MAKIMMKKQLAPYEAPRAELFGLPQSMHLLLRFSAESEFEEVESGGDLDTV